MKKLLLSLTMALLLCFAISVSCFAAAPPGTVTVTAGGVGGNVTVTTVASDTTSNDVVNVTTPGAFSLTQTNSFINTTGNQWTSNAGEISRVVGFGTGVSLAPASAGSITTTTNQISTQPYALYDATTTTSVSVTGGTGAGGYLQEGVAFGDINGSGASGVASYYYYPGQIVNNTMTLSATGNYSLSADNIGASIVNGGSIPPGNLPAYSLNIGSTATGGTSTLAFTPTADNALSGSAAAGGLANYTSHSGLTGMTANFVLGFTGTPAVNVAATTVTGGSFAIVNNFVNNTVSGSGTIQ